MFVVASTQGISRDKKFALLAQIFMTLMMAFTLSGILSAIHNGLDMDWLKAWPLQFITAWPIAFVATMIFWPLAMKCDGAVLKAQAKGARRAA